MHRERGKQRSGRERGSAGSTGMREARVPGDARAQERSRPADGAAGRTEPPGGRSCRADGAAGRTEPPGGPGHPPTGPGHPKERSGPPTDRPGPPDGPGPRRSGPSAPRRPGPGYPTEKCTARPRNGMVIQGPGWAIIASSAIATPSTP
ncbi:hypothetical protein SCA03_14320 [Streptomyces cacaoi]|uniref:Uncharacterized protein n=1 Tax=Streptomyces cacaoi TaxID=1898 RepID=A0A4Y3QUF8_STRCI|nr:hypothetical protein SCA03_14320 [Streptomyces cacaoi]